MAVKEIKNIEASVLARLRNRAKEDGLPFLQCLQLFFQEEFLRRLGKSSYVDSFILKGGMMIYTLTEFDSRTTKDIDFMLRNLSGEQENLMHIINEICDVKTENHYVEIRAINITEEIEDAEYPGSKVKLIGRLGSATANFSIDIGINDIVIPNPIMRSITTRLPEFSRPMILTYSLESTISEKFDAIVKRMETTSRMKDFFDIYYLSEMFDFDGSVLQTAIKATLENRNRKLEQDTMQRIQAFEYNMIMENYWNNFDPGTDSGLQFSTALKRIVSFIGPVSQSILEDNSFEMNWISKKGTWV